MPDIDRLTLRPEELCRKQDPATFQFECTEELTPLSELIGQARAERALEFGLRIDKPGYNVFVTGLTGTGKTTAVLEFVQREVAERRARGEASPPSDWCYVFNFSEPDRPRALRLPPGRGRQLRDRLEALLALVRTNLQRAFTSQEYDRQRRMLMEEGERQAEALMTQAQAEAAAAGFALTFSPTGVSIVPLKSEPGQAAPRPMTPEEYAALPAEERAEIQRRQAPVSDLVAETGRRLRELQHQVVERLRELDRLVADTVMAGSFEAIMSDFEDLPDVHRFLAELRSFTVENAALLLAEPEPRAAPQDAAFPPPPPDGFAAYSVNLFVDNGGREEPPIVIERNPTWTNLFGRIERKAYFGTYVSDHRMLRPGSVHRANGGYLVLNFSDIAAKPGVWDGLKRLIRTKEARLEDPFEQYGMLTPQTLRPAPIPVDLKVIVTGDPMAYFLLTAFDEDFWELFKVKADFDSVIPRTPENVLAYAGFVCAVSEREGLRHFDRTAVARLVEHGSRMVDDQEKLSARFGRLHDVLVEADYWAQAAGSDLVRAEHVEQAIRERVYRLNLVEEKIREMIARGTLMVDVDGAVPGQVNGLAVHDFGDFSFGRPTRITARTFLGQRGVVSIDRESQLSGKTHDKGVLTLSGYLGWKYAQDKPLSLSATVSFEQGYDTVDGDSASLAELCAILSAIAGVPVRQDLAVTGSVNQKGEVQPIGGVNQKVEGFHDVCRAIGFTGKQGVVIPRRNQPHLMLRRDVLESVERGDFRVLAVSTVDEALEALTGLEAGERGPDGAYPEGSLHQRVDARLREMGEAMRQFGRRAADGPRPEAAPAEEPQEPPRIEVNDDEA